MRGRAQWTCPSAASESATRRREYPAVRPRTILAALDRPARAPMRSARLPRGTSSLRSSITPSCHSPYVALNRLGMQARLRANFFVRTAFPQQRQRFAHYVPLFFQQFLPPILRDADLTRRRLHVQASANRANVLQGQFPIEIVLVCLHPFSKNFRGFVESHRTKKVEQVTWL